MKNLFLTIALVALLLVSFNTIAGFDINDNNWMVCNDFEATSLTVSQQDTSLAGLKKALNDEAKKVLSERNSSLTPESENLLNKIIAEGAKRLKRDGVTKKRLRQAKANVRKFTFAMTTNSTETKSLLVGDDKGLKNRQVTEDSVKTAEESLCPLFYPICN